MPRRDSQTHRPRRRRSPVPPSRRRLTPALQEWMLFRLDRAAATVRDLTQGRLEDWGLTLSEAAVLLVLSEIRALPQTTLGERVGLERSSASELLRGLEEEGLVEVRPHASDGRKHTVVLTEAGQEEADSLAQPLRAAQDDFLAPLDEDERAQLRSLLERLEPPPYLLGDLSR